MTEQEREQLLDQGLRDTERLPVRAYRHFVIRDLIAAGWVSPEVLRQKQAEAPEDVIESVARHLAKIYGAAEIDDAVEQFTGDARSLADAGLLATPPDESWDALMALLDKHWPESIFPTLEDDEERGAGARIVSLIRWIDRLRTPVQQDCPSGVARGDL